MTRGPHVFKAMNLASHHVFNAKARSYSFTGARALT